MAENRTIKLNKDPYATGVNLFPKDEITFTKGITTLIGCNGSGKTTLLKSIKEYLKKEDIKFFEYNNYKDGGQNAMSFYSFTNNLSMLATNMTSSEGEEIYINFGIRFLREIGKFIRNNPDTKEIWFLIDSIDSGLSIDNIEEVRDILKKICDEEDKDLYFIISANSFELVYDTNAILVESFKMKKFKRNNYLSYTNVINNSKRFKDKRIKKENKLRKDETRNGHNN